VRVLIELLRIGLGNIGDFIIVVLLFGLILALISGIFVGFVAKGLRTPQN
jgi:hypothetical protein